MKQLHVLSAGLLALGLCYVNATNLDSGSYKFAKYTLGSMLADNGDYTKQSPPEINDDGSAITPAQKAIKKNSPDTDDGLTDQNPDTSDLNNETPDTDNEED